VTFHRLILSVYMCMGISENAHVRITRNARNYGIRAIHVSMFVFLGL
jgi:hypothetical protein